MDVFFILFYLKSSMALILCILTISGTSRDNVTSDCHVNVIINDVKLYQNASAADTGGANDDYSNWTFSLAPKYTTIKEGANKITAKFSCNSNDGVASSFYSVNVTGVLPSSNNKLIYYC
jgi:hypothetical protein